MPKVCIVIGGGWGTLKNVAESVAKGRPVVVLPETGGAARAIYSSCYDDEGNPWCGEAGCDVRQLVHELGWTNGPGRDRLPEMVAVLERIKQKNGECVVQQLCSPSFL